MSAKNKIFITIALVAWLVMAGLVFISSNKTKVVVAKNEDIEKNINNSLSDYGGIMEKYLGGGNNGVDYVCDEPIPVGNAVQESLNVLGDIYREVQNTRNYLKIAINQVNSEISDIYRDPNSTDKAASVCNYSVCQPKTLNKAPDINFKIDFGLGKPKNLFGIRPPLCTALQCSGDPCADVSDYRDSLIKMKDAVAGSYDIIHKIFSENNYKVNYDIAKPGERLGKGISRLEYVRRLITLSRAWFHAPGGNIRKTCVLSEKQRREVKEGKRSDIFPLPCKMAINMNIYWPKAWSEKCESKCSKNMPTEECKQCLGTMTGTPTSYRYGSFLLRFNYYLYQGCKQDCYNDPANQACQDCLMKKLSDSSNPLTFNQFIKKVCGGSRFNLVCCHKIGQQ